MKNPEQALAAVEAIKASSAPILSPDDVAKVLCCDAQSIRVQASKDPSMLGFPVCRMGQTTMIPRRPFLRWLLGE